jgi:ketosteroid isomerase-like protein
VSKENVEIVRKIFDGWSQGDFSVGKDLVTPDFEWDQHADAVEPGPRHGSGIATTLSRIFEVWEGFRVVPERYVDGGDRILVLARNQGRNRQTGLEVEQPFGYLWTLDSGKLARVQVFTSHERALEASGLEK